MGCHKSKQQIEPKKQHMKIDNQKKQKFYIDELKKSNFKSPQAQDVQELLIKQDQNNKLQHKISNVQNTEQKSHLRLFKSIQPNEYKPQGFQEIHLLQSPTVIIDPFKRFEQPTNKQIEI